MECDSRHTSNNFLDQVEPFVIGLQFFSPRWLQNKNKSPKLMWLRFQILKTIKLHKGFSNCKIELHKEKEQEIENSRPRKCKDSSSQKASKLPKFSQNYARKNRDRVRWMVNQRGLTILGRVVIGAASKAAVWTKWYRDAVCHTFKPNNTN